MAKLIAAFACHSLDCNVKMINFLITKSPILMEHWHNKSMEFCQNVAKCLFSKSWLLTHHTPSVTYMRQWIGRALVQVMVCRLFDAKPLPEAMVTYCQLRTNFSEIWIEIQKLSFMIMHLEISAKWQPLCAGGVNTPPMIPSIDKRALV